jgi:predicted MFS family arabinose efflux permease
MCGVAYFISGLISVLTIKKFKRRSVLIVGHLCMSSMHAGVIFFASSKNEDGILSMVVLFIFSYNMSSGHLCWMYNTETTIDVGLGICFSILMLTNFFLTLICPLLMDANSLGPSKVFIMFSVFSFIGAVYAFCILKETKGLNDR